jgi:DNA repair exonuclease SbcCD ATPase subunit
MRPKSLIINDLYSFGKDVVVNFTEQDQGKILILGRNLEDPGMDSNGSGKSSIFNVIFWVITGEIFQDKENINEIIRTRPEKCSEGSAILVLSDNKNTLKIDRGRGKKEYLKIEYNGENKTCRTATQTQQELYRLLNINPNAKPKEITSDFLNTCYFSNATVKGFMAKDTTSKERFDLIARFLNLKNYDTASVLAKKKKDEILSSISAKLDALTVKEKQLSDNPIEGYLKKKSDLEANIIPTTEGKIVGMEGTIAKEAERINLASSIPKKEEQIGNKKRDTESQLNTLQEAFNRNSNQISRLLNEKMEYASLQKRISLNLEKANQANQQATELLKTAQKTQEDISALQNKDGSVIGRWTQLNLQLDKALSCPKCKASLMLTNNALSEIDTNKLKEEIASVQNQHNLIKQETSTKAEEIKKINEQIAQHNKVVEAHLTDQKVLERMKKPDAIDLEIAQTNEYNSRILKQSQDIKETAVNEVHKLQDELKELKDKLNGLGNPECNVHQMQVNLDREKYNLSSLNKELGSIIQYIRQIEELKADVSSIQAEIGNKKKEAEIYSFWEIGFKEIKIQIIKEFLPKFEDTVNEYLERIHIGLRVDFDTEKVKATATKKELSEGKGFKEEFSAYIIKDGNMLPFGMHSLGERGRIGMCVGFALNKLSREKGNNLFEFLMLDEVADSLDETGLNELVKLLDEIPGQKYVISHNDKFKDMFDYTIIVEKSSDGISRIAA